MNEGMEHMKEQDWIAALEKSNQEYIESQASESPEMLLARKLLTLKRDFPFHIMRWYKARHQYLETQRKSFPVSHPVPPEKRFYFSAPPVHGKKGVVYTCITAGYDLPIEPLFQDPALDYVLFTDDLNVEGKSVWAKRPISNELPVRETGNQTNRRYKLHPFDSFPGYDYAIYIDGNVRIMSDITALYRCAEQAKLGVAMHRHAQRSCLYEEALWCEYNHRGNQEKMRLQIDAYRREGMPESFGLWEATIIVTDLKNPLARQALSLWWEEYSRWGSGRDQIAFPYVLWKNGWRPEDVGCLGNDEYHNPKFRINAHRGTLY